MSADFNDLDSLSTLIVLQQQIHSIAIAGAYGPIQPVGSHCALAEVLLGRPRWGWVIVHAQWFHGWRERDFAMQYVVADVPFYEPFMSSLRDSISIVVREEHQYGTGLHS